MFKPIDSSELATVCGGLNTPLEQPQTPYQPPLQERVPTPFLQNLQVPPYTLQPRGKKS